MTQTKLDRLLDGGRYFEGPRWHAGRLEQLRQGKSSARIDVADVEIPGAGYP